MLIRATTVSIPYSLGPWEKTAICIASEPAHCSRCLPGAGVGQPFPSTDVQRPTQTDFVSHLVKQNSCKNIKQWESTVRSQGWFLAVSMQIILTGRFLLLLLLTWIRSASLETNFGNCSLGVISPGYKDTPTVCVWVKMKSRCSLLKENGCLSIPDTVTALGLKACGMRSEFCTHQSMENNALASVLLHRPLLK